MSAAATRAVINNLDKLHGDMWESVGTRMSGQTQESFTTRAKAWLGDRSNLKGSTINGADWDAVYRYFTTGSEA